MALVLADRVRETTTVTGTGTATLLGAVSGYQSFAAVGNANTTYYVIANQSASEWEVGIGTYTSSGTTLSRTTVLSSSNSGSLVNFSAGTKDVFVDYPAGRAVYEDASGNIDSYPITGGTIDNTVIGGTTPAAGTFTTVTTPIVGAASGSSTTGLDLNVNSKAQARIVEIGDGTRPLVINGGSAGGVQTAGITATTVLAISGGGGNPVRFYTNGRVTTQQAEISHTASAVNYVQVTGAATGSPPQISSQGSDSSIYLDLGSKGNNGVRVLPELFAGRNSANYWVISGGASGYAPTNKVAGTDTNISQVFQSKGTGAIDLAAGSSGVNISNGGTVTAITRTATGSGYTSFPSLAISAPTTASGVQAVASVAQMVSNTATIQAGGTGYTLNDVVTLVGGTPATVAATYTITAVSGGVVTAVTPLNFTAYTVLPTNPVSVTGGTGSALTLNVTYAVQSAFTITNAGSGYVEQPTVSFSGGGGSGAAAYATVGSGTTLKSLGSTFNVYVDNSSGRAFQFYNSGGTTDNFWSAASGGSAPFLYAQGSTNTTGRITSNGTGSISIYTNGGGQQQFNVSHTASAVNYVQVTGAATSIQPVISAQGSDTNVGLILTSKGTSSFQIRTNNNNNVQMFVTHTASSVNWVQMTGAVAGSAPSYAVAGSDTDIDLTLTPKGAGNVRFGTYTATVTAVAGYILIKDSGGTTRKLAVLT